MQREHTSVRITGASGFRDKPGSLNEAVTISFEAAGLTRLAASNLLRISEADETSSEHINNISWALEGAARLMVLSLQIVEEHGGRAR